MSSISDGMLKIYRSSFQSIELFQLIEVRYTYFNRLGNALMLQRIAFTRTETKIFTIKVSEIFEFPMLSIEKRIHKKNYIFLLKMTKFEMSV